MKKFFYYLYIFLMVCRIAYADKLKVTIEPPNPVVNENFDLIFEIESSEKSDVKVFFDPSRAKILSRKYGNVSVNATVINGRVSVKRVVSHVYTLATDRPGLLVVKNVKAELGKKILRHKNIRINIGRNKNTTGNEIFLLAQPTKKSVYLGEGFNIKYYLYYRIPVVEQITDFFPKLKGFFKRTPTNIASREETVEHQGMIYKRILLYSYRLYPEKIGKLTIDPYGVEVGYLKSRVRSGTFWRLGGGVKRTRKIRSKRVPIEVLPLPAEDIPKNFVGLVEDHDFKISVNKKKFLVNEVVEVRLEVTGPGALEQLAAPSIYDHDRLEAFDVKSNIVEITAEKVKKTFDYTFLTRGHLNIAPRDLKIHLFDPVNDRYFEKIVSIPGLSVHGGIAEKEEQTGEKEDLPLQKEQGKVVENNRKRVLLAPVFYPGFGSLAFPWLDYLNILLILVIVFLPSYWFFEKYIGRRKNEIHALMKSFSKGKLEYAKVHRFISLLNERRDNPDIVSVINNSQLSPEAKKYFINLLDNVAESQYGVEGKNTQSHFNPTYFKEVCRLLFQKS